MIRQASTDISVSRQVNAAAGATCSITRDSPTRAALHVVATGGYVAAKWCLSPVFYLARRSGWTGRWPRRLDAAINRVVLPLTERADNARRCDVTPTLRPGDPIPDLSVRFADGAPCSIRSLCDRPLLLVLIRGSWCVYSRLHLADLNAMLTRFEAANIRVVAVSSYPEANEWQALGVRIPVAVDPDGALFSAFGVRLDQWMETAWGRVLPHESAFLFDAAGRLIAADVRRVSGYHTGQTFLSGDEWLRIVNSHNGSLPGQPTVS
jgi:peroxiredoxin